MLNIVTIQNIFLKIVLAITMEKCMYHDKKKNLLDLRICENLEY